MKKMAIYNFSKTFTLIIGWLIIFDLSVQGILHVSPSKLSRIEQYFNYGLSVETQIRRMLDSGLKSNSVLYSGWFDRESYREKGVQADITMYGMSFSNHVADQIRDLKPEISIRTISGPAAPLNHSYYAYQIDRGICRSEYVVLGILASSLKNINAMTNDTLGVDSPFGSFYPTYVQDGSALRILMPEINSFEELETSINDNLLWARHLENLKKNDKHYKELIYKSNILDNFISGRLFKRWYKAKNNNLNTNKVHNSRGFDQNSNSIQLTNVLVSNFIREARENNSIPIVLLFQPQGYDDHLFLALEETLEQNNVYYINSHEIVPATDPQNFISDGHYTKENDRKIAFELINIINKDLKLREL